MSLALRGRGAVRCSNSSRSRQGPSEGDRLLAASPVLAVASSPSPSPSPPPPLPCHLRRSHLRHLCEHACSTVTYTMSPERALRARVWSRAHANPGRHNPQRQGRVRKLTLLLSQHPDDGPATASRWLIVFFFFFFSVSAALSSAVLCAVPEWYVVRCIRP